MFSHIIARFGLQLASNIENCTIGSDNSLTEHSRILAAGIFHALKPEGIAQSEYCTLQELKIILYGLTNYGPVGCLDFSTALEIGQEISSEEFVPPEVNALAHIYKQVRS